MANNIIRSFRYDDHTESILLKFKGDNLNQKFINMVLYCFDEEKRLSKLLEQKHSDLQKLENSVDVKRKELYNLDKLLSNGRELTSALNQISTKVNDFNSSL